MRSPPACCRSTASQPPRWPSAGRSTSTNAGHVFGIELPHACSARHGSWRSSLADGDLVGFFVMGHRMKQQQHRLLRPLGLNGHHGSRPESHCSWRRSQCTARHRKPPSHRRCAGDPNHAEHCVFSGPLDPGRRARRRPDRRLIGSCVTAAHRRRSNLAVRVVDPGAPWAIGSIVGAGCIDRTVVDDLLLGS